MLMRPFARHAASLRHVLVAACLGAALSACQTADIEGALDPAAIPPPQAGPVGAETLGNGAVSVALLLPRGAGGEVARAAVEYRDGAALAVADLGADHVKLTVLDTEGQAATARTRAREAAEAGARLILGPASAAELEAAAAARRRNEPPMLALVDNAAPRPAGVFAFLSDEVDGALAVAAHARVAGKRNVLVLAAPDLPSASAARLKAGIESQDGSLLGPLAYRPSQGLAGAGGELVARAEAVILFAGADPVSAIAALRAAGLPADAMVLGTAGWTRQHQTSPALSGALVPVPDQSGLREVSARMQAAYGRPLTVEAAHGYDAVALAAGVVRAMGAQGLATATLRQPTGFRGATGAFRFGQDGSVTRLYAIYRAGPGGLKLVGEAAAGF